jgi:chromosome segregation ATPase
MLLAYINVEMGEEKGVTERWAACHQMIAELQPLVMEAKARERRATEQRRQQQEHRRRRFQEINAEIASLENEIALARNSPLDADIIEEEIMGIRARLQRLAQERDRLNEEVTNDA